MRVSSGPLATLATVTGFVCLPFWAGCPAPGSEGEDELPACDERSLVPAASAADRGVLVVLAGEGTAGFVDGAGGNARFNGVGGIARGDGFFVISDIFNGSLRKVTDDGVVSTILGVPFSRGTVDGVCDEVRMNGPRGVAIDQSDGSVWFGDGPCLRRADLKTGETTTVAGDCTTAGDADGSLTEARFGFLFHDIEIAADTGLIYIADRKSVV